MAELPVLVVHGAILWKVLLAVLVAASFGLVTLVRVCWLRWRVRADVRARLGNAGRLDEGYACFRGRLRDGALATLAGGRVRHHHADGQPYIECADGQHVELAGVHRVVVGSRAATSRWGVPAGTPPSIGDRGGRWILHSVEGGDAIVARGKLARIAQGGALYRAGTTRWRLTDGEIAALAPSTRLRPARPLALAAGLAVALVGWFGVLHAIGSSALQRLDRVAHRAPERATEREVAPFGDLAIAAAMPGSREEALKKASRTFQWRYHHRASVVALRDAIDATIGPCWGMEAQLREARLEVALESARACGDRESEAFIQLFLGNYEAALVSRQPRIRELAAIGVGDWNAAGAAADAQATLHGPEHAAHARCRAAWYRNLAGAATSVPDEDHPLCSIYAVLAEPVERRPELLRAIEASEARARLRDQSRMPAVRALLGVPARFARPWAEIEWAFADHMADATKGHDQIIGRTVIAVLRGDVAHARLEVAALEPGPDRDTLASWIALREGSELPRGAYRHPALESTMLLREGKLPPDLEMVAGDGFPQSCRSDLRNAVADAVAGDGGPLGQTLAECSVFYISLPEHLFGILPRVTERRAELADALRVYRDDWGMSSTRRWPFRLVAQLAEYRALARLAGDAAEAERMQAIVTRHMQVLTDRDRVAAFVLLE
jgi:hypothetical protein